MRKWTRWVACLAFPLLNHAQAGIATWNVAWLMDKPTHVKWRAACAAIGWKSEDELKAAGQTVPASLQGLPYCDVHDGIDFRIKPKCLSAIGADLKNRPTSVDSPDKKCRVSPDLADWAQYQIKLDTLRETFRELEKTGVTLVALQEVSNEEAVRAILPSGWAVKTSASLPGTPAIAQHVGVAWKATVHTPTDFKLLMTLSEIGDRPLRPGLVFFTDLKGRPVEFLAVHMKAGCRTVPIDKPRSASEKDACAVLAQQVPAVESWIDARVGKDFVILGDFNRSLLKEMEQYPSPDPVRFGATPAASISAMAPEWNDNSPRGSTLHVVPHKKKADGTPIAGDYACAQTPGIDHILLSEHLYRRLGPNAASMELQPVGYRLNGARLPVSKSTVTPSDHCARFVRVP